MKVHVVVFLLLLTLLSVAIADITVTGSVHYSGGLPAEGIEVYLLDEDTDIMESTVTLSDGSYILTSHWDGYFMVATEIWSSDEIDPVNYEIETVHGETYSGYDFTILTGTEYGYIEGMVYHWVGEPIGGRFVYATGPEDYTVVSSSDGYSIRCIPGSYHVILDLETEEYSYDVEVSPGETVSGIDFHMMELPDNGWVTVQTRYVDSSPAGGVEIHLFSDFTDETATSNAGGFAFFEVWGRHNYHLECSFDGYMSDPADYDFLLTEGDSVLYLFTFIDTSTTECTGYVYAEMDGTPMGDLDFEYSHITSPDWTTVRTGTDGYTSFRVTETGTYTVRPIACAEYSILPESCEIILNRTNECDTASFSVFPELVKEPEVPETFEISLYPNPFNSACHINAPEGSKVTIYNLNGKVVANLSDNYIWEPAAEVSSGIYHVHVETDHEKITQQLMYIK